MNIVTIKINGREYNLRGRENEIYLLEVAKYVDGKVNEVMGNNRKLSSTDGATLAALNVADEYFKAECEVESLTKKKNTLEERNVALKERIKEVRSETEVLINEKDGEIQSLKNIIESMKEQLKENQDLKYKVEYLTNELSLLDELKKEVEVLNVKLAENKDIIESKDNECIEAKEIAVALEGELKEVKTLSEERCSNIIKEKLELENINNELHNKIEACSLKISEMEDENNLLSEKEEGLNQKIDELEKNISEMINDDSEVEECRGEIDKLKEEIRIMNETVRKNLKEKEFLKARNKEVKFQAQNYKYKILDLEKKLIDIQVDLAKEKRGKNVLLR